MDELPEEMEAGLALMLTVGAGFEVTVTVALADVLPPAPVAVAV
jgi:xanthosine utilization system XapX-like protein